MAHLDGVSWRERGPAPRTAAPLDIVDTSGYFKPPQLSELKQRKRRARSVPRPFRLRGKAGELTAHGRRSVGSGTFGLIGEWWVGWDSNPWEARCKIGLKFTV